MYHNQDILTADEMWITVVFHMKSESWKTN